MRVDALWLKILDEAAKINDAKSAVRNDPFENLINVKIDQETKNKINQIYNNGKKYRVSDKFILE